MRATCRLIHGGCLIALVLAPCLAWGQGRYYAGAGLGYSKSKISAGALGIAGATVSALSIDDNAVGWKAYGGYRLNPNLGVELGYVSLGTISATRTMTAPGTGVIHRSTKNAGLFADLVGTLPIGAGGFSAIGRIGGVYSHTRSHYSLSGGVALTPGLDSRPAEREINWKHGLGAQYELSRTAAARAEWERYARLGKDTTTGEHTADLFSINLHLRF
jgi:OOP family OmpA-OmpF porin